MRILRRACLGSMIALSLTGAAWAQQGSAVSNFDVPAGNLAQGVNGISQQSGVQVIYDIALLNGKQVPALKGRLTFEQALERTLRGTGLTYEFINPSTVVLKQNGVTPTSAPAQSGGRRTPPDSTATEEATRLEAVRVTGSRLKRSDVEGPAQVIQIDRAEIERAGVSTVRELINTLPQAAVAMDESGNNSWLGSATIQLRGLSYGSTLVLINGRRVNASGAQASRNFFDLNTIPLEAVERVEVLTDTASAVYGGDAIGGAINFILRKDYQGAVLGTRYGTSYNNDGTEKSASFMVGGSGDRFSGVLVFEHLERDPILSRDRDLTSTMDFRRFGGPDGRSTYSYPGNIYALPGTGNLPGLQSTFAGVPTGTNGIGLTPADFAATDGVLNMQDVSPWTVFSPGANRTGAMATGRFQVNEQMAFIGEVMYSRTKQLIEIGSDAVYGGNIGYVVVPAYNPFNPFGVDVGVDFRFMELGPRQDDSTNTFTRLLAGVEGSFRGLDWDLVLMSDKDENSTVERNFIDLAKVQQYLNMSDPNVALNVFTALGGNNPDTLNAIRLRDNYVTGTGATMLESTLSGGWDMLGTRLSYAFGVMGRRETLRWDSSSHIDAQRNIKAAYFESSLPFQMSNGRRLEFSLAGRYDEYDDFGSSFNPQFGVLWKPVSSLLLRFSAGTAFKAPSMYDVHAPLTILPSAIITDPLRNNETYEVEYRYGGSDLVQPEEGKSVTAGFIFEPEALPGLSLGATAFSLKQENFITRYYDSNVILTNAELFGDRIHRADPTPADIAAGLPGRLLRIDMTTLNFGEVRVRGVDLQTSYAFDVGDLGRFVWSINGAYIDSYRVVLMPGDEPTEGVGRANRAGYPVKFKGNTGLQWSLGGWSANVRARYLHGYVDYDGVGRIPAKWWYDAQASYSFGDAGRDTLSGLSLVVGVINASNNQGRYANNFVGYDFQQDDLRGRYFYANVKYAF